MELLSYALYAHLVLAIFGLIFIIRNKFIDRKKRALQAIFNFLIPLVGPLLTIIIYVTDILKPTSPSDRYMGQSVDESNASSFFNKI